LTFIIRLLAAKEQAPRNLLLLTPWQDQANNSFKFDVLRIAPISYLYFNLFKYLGGDQMYV
jgi:hypothetical protein